MELTKTKAALSVPKGYKQTEVGVIPEDWEVSSFEELFKVKGGGTFKSKDKVSNGVKWLKIANVGVRKIKWDDIEYLPAYFLNSFSEFVLNENDVVMALTRPILSYKLKIAKIKKDDSPCLLNQRVGKIEPYTNLDLDWIYHMIQSHKSIIGLMDSMAGTDPPNLSNKGIYSVRIPLPPTLKEQKAIATVLSDTDALIQALEQKIAKKKRIKKGVMQQLLTPKEGWEELNLGESAILKARIGWQGLTTAEYLNNGNYFLITGTDFKNGYIDWGNCVFVKKNRYDQDKNIQIQKEDVLVTKDGTIGKVALVDKVPKPTTLNSGVFVIRPKNKAFNSKYFYYVLMSNHFDKFLSKLTAGSTISHLYQKDFIHFTFPIPPTYEEQEQIAQVLFVIDQEIENLEQKLSKYQRIKQGLMQQLLTGKIRLVV